MKYVDIVSRIDDPRYESVYAFAHDIYVHKLDADVQHRPPIFITIYEDGQIRGCIGLNAKVESEVFVKDLRLRRYQQMHPDLTFADQSFLAVNRCILTTRLLITAIAAYAQAMMIHQILFCGAQTFYRLVQRLGLPTTNHGEVYLNQVSNQTRSVMQTWQKMYDPVICSLDTSLAKNAFAALLAKHGNVVLGEEIQGIIFGGHTIHYAASA